jgi:hypothetical protein
VVRWVFLFTVAILAGCSGSGPTGIDVKGAYTGTHTFTVLLDGQPFAEITCQGSIAIDDESGRSFGGTLVIQPCDPIPAFANTIDGTLGNGRAVSFTLTNQGALIGSLLEQFDCVATRVDQAFVGTIGSSDLDATLTATLACEELGNVDVTWVIEMQKTS